VPTLSLSRPFLSLVAWCLLAFGAGTVFGFEQAANPVLPNFDRRDPSGPRGLGAQGQPVEKLKQRVRGLEVEFDRVTGAPKWVRSREEFLSGAKGQGRAISAQVAQGFAVDDPHRAIKAFLKEHSELFGHGPEVLERARLRRDFKTEHNGLHTAVWEQEYEGIPVFEGLLISNTTAEGELASVSSQFVPDLDAAANQGLAAWRALKEKPKISAKGALVKAAQNLGVELAEDDVVLEEQKPRHYAKIHAAAGRRAALLRGALVQMCWVPFSRTTMRLAWEVYLTRTGTGEQYRLLVDAETGEVIARHLRSFNLSEATYRVFTTASPAPMRPGPSTPTTDQAPVVERSLITIAALSTNA